MFEITDLKEKKLQDLQAIAKELNISKYRSLKKLDLVYKILDHQAANPVQAVAAPKEDKPKSRERVQRRPQRKEQKPKAEQHIKREAKETSTDEKPKPS